MHAGEQYSVGVGTGETGREEQPARRSSRVPMALAWIAGGVALFVLILRISLTTPVTSDGANPALQAWDLLHGHLLLHGWLLGDATYYTFELPLIALVEVLFGLHTITVHVAMAVVYVLVAVCAVAIAVTGATGAAARLSRAAVVVAVLAAPTLIVSNRWVPLGFPDHTGTSVFLLVSCLLVDRATSRRFTAPLLCVILCAGQLGDVTVRYAVVPAICVVAVYRMVAARKFRTGDAAILVAAVVSVPLETAVRALMRHFGAYLMVSPKTKLAPVSQWPHNAAWAWVSLRRLFGMATAPGGGPAGAWALFGFVCLLAAAAGLLAVLVRWPRARRAEQVLAVAIVVNIGAYVISTLPGPNTMHDIVAVVPAGAVLAARLLVPARLTSQLGRLAVSGVAAVAAALPLSLIAAQPTASTAGAQRLVDWLEAHNLSYGLGGYWNASAVTVQASDQVQIRTIKVIGGKPVPYAWETNTLWFDPSRHYANFIVAEDNDPGTVPVLEGIFGKPAYTHRLGGIEILVYSKNLLTELKPAIMPRVS
jgi:hypothetical protein